MDVLLVSCRALPATPSQPHWSRRAAAATAAALAGHPDVRRVRWLCPVSGEEGPLEIPGPDHGAVGGGAEVLVESIPGEPGPFTDPQGRLGDAATDRALTHAMRRELPDIVHCFGMGSPGSCALVWIAERMGRSAIVSVRSAEVLCHRLDLDPWDGPGPCATWWDPERCVRCCAAAKDGPAVPPDGWSGNGLTPLGFQNRLELALGNLMPAREILVGGEAERERLVRAGLPAARMTAVPDLEVPDLKRYGLGAG